MNRFLKVVLLVIVLESLAAIPAQGQSDYRSLHQSAIVIDTHADVLLPVLRGADISKRLTTGHVDLIRLKEGGVDAQFFSIWPNPHKFLPDSMYERCIEMIDKLDEIVAANPDKIMLATSPQDIEMAVKQNKIAACIGVEGGSGIESSLEKLQTFYDRGARYLSLTWNDSPGWATSAEDETDPKFTGKKGLTDFGKQVIHKMNELGMMVDVSHSGEQTFWDVIATTTKPIIASHSNAWSLCPVFRNLKDDQIKALAKNGGVTGINFYAGFLEAGFDSAYGAIRKSMKSELETLREKYANDELGYRKARNAMLAERVDTIRPGIAKLVDHMDYIINLVGDDYVGLGSDFDGISVTPKGMEDVSYLPLLTKEMQRRGYSDERIRKILGGNFMRVFREVTKK